MDPDKALEDARAAADNMKAFIENNESLSSCTEDVVDLYLAFEALDGWLSMKGFLPKDWSR